MDRVLQIVRVLLVGEETTFTADEVEEAFGDHAAFLTACLNANCEATYHRSALSDFYRVRRKAGSVRLTRRK